MNGAGVAARAIDAVIFDQRFDDRVERLLDDFFGLQLREANLFRDGLHDFFLGHEEFPYDKLEVPFGGQRPC